ncbi:MAG: hydrogenase iron-sulfur subunit [Spirochaetia bacterium]
MRQGSSGPALEFKPQIVAFCCTYCAYSAADLAGSMRLNYSPYVRIIKLPCTGKVDPLFILKAFEKGADGVFVAGCLEGSCHFVNGNINARKRVEYTKGLLQDVGINPERLEMFNLSSSMGRRFAEICDLMTDKIRALGRLKIHEIETIEAASG